MRLTLVLSAKKAYREFAALKKSPIEGKSMTDYLLWIFKEKDLTISGFKSYLDKKRLDSIQQVNNFFEVDFARLGAELHAATYTVKLGGKYQLVNNSRWIGLDEKNQNLGDILPAEKTNNFRVQGLDFSNTVIQCDGLDNIEFCQNLKTLIFKDCKFIDDWSLAKLANMNSNEIETLDISGCESVTDSGLIMLGYLSKLKRLKLENLNAAKNREFISVLLEETLQGLEIEGCDHLSDDSLKQLELRFEQETNQYKKLK